MIRLYFASYTVLFCSLTRTWQKKSGFFSFFGGQSRTCEQFCENCDLKYICISCDLKFNSNSELWLHYLSEISTGEDSTNNKSDNKKPSALCPFCNNTCVNAKPLISEKPLSDLAITTPNKEKKIFSITRLRQHLKAHHGMLPCDNCHEVFYTEVALNHHFKTCHLFLCVICNESFSTEEIEELHKKEAHLIKCPRCDLYFTTKVLYLQHFNEHLSLCSICNKYFGDDNARNQHIMLAHKVCCSLCKKYCNTMIELIHHYDDFHRISCDLCTSIFPDKESLRKHQSASHPQV